MSTAAAVARALPHNLEAERSVLGAILIDNNVLPDVRDIVGPAAFFRDAHRRILEAILALDQRRYRIDLVTLCEELERRGELDEVGGPAYVASLVDGVPHATNVQYYARIVRDRWILRRIIFSGQKLLSMAYEGDREVAAILQAAEAELLELSRDTVGSDGFVDAHQWMTETYAVIEAAAERRQIVTGVASGVRKLDYMTRGFQPSDMVIVAGRPSMGKTALTLQMACHAAREGTVGYFSIEMSRQALGIRAVALEAGVDSYRILTGNLASEHYERIAHAIELIDKSHFHIDETGSLTVGLLRSRARRLAARCPADAPLRLLVVDYIGLMDTDDLDAETRQQAIARLSRALKAVAKELRIPVIVVVQLNRNPESRTDKRPQMSDLRESGALEQDADVIILVHRPDYYMSDEEALRQGVKGMAEIILAKQRNGPTGTIKLKYHGGQTRFSEWEEEQRGGE